jgi:hypothetical protein
MTGKNTVPLTKIFENEPKKIFKAGSKLKMFFSVWIVACKNDRLFLVSTINGDAGFNNSGIVGDLNHSITENEAILLTINSNLKYIELL